MIVTCTTVWTVIHFRAKFQVLYWEQKDARLCINVTKGYLKLIFEKLEGDFWQKDKRWLLIQLRENHLIERETSDNNPYQHPSYLMSPSLPMSMDKHYLAIQGRALVFRFSVTNLEGVFTYLYHVFPLDCYAWIVFLHKELNPIVGTWTCEPYDVLVLGLFISS